MKPDTEQLIHLLAFGMIADVLEHTEKDWPWSADTSTLRAALIQAYPELTDLPFVIAVNMEVASGVQPIPPGATVALLPPYSGG
ncbi:MAG: MoaD/ThiS family protein [Saprospiraceae bacterium]